MENEFVVVFLSNRANALGPIARAIFSMEDKDHLTGCKAKAAATGSESPSPWVLQYLATKGIQPTVDIVFPETEALLQSIDLIVTLGKINARPMFIGNPVQVQWDIADPLSDAFAASDLLEKRYQQAYQEIQSHVQALIHHGMLTALVAQHRQMQHMMDAVEDGLIVHDQARRIYLFNKAAERITGFRKEEILGKKCQEVFLPDGLCSSQCPFNSQDRQNVCSHDYEIAFTNRGGEDRRLKVWMAPLPNQPGQQASILAFIRDVTEVRELRWKIKEKYSFHGMAGRSPAMQEIFRTIRQVTTSDYPVLITGESGTGKELVARAIHNESRRQGGPFVPINCGALPETILESELFGHVRGAFTGAIRDKKGRFELAQNGTLFLDEVGELSPSFQVKLLRVLEEKRFEPVGGERSIDVDVRVLAATNRDLRRMVLDGSFREDLFYRLAVVPVHIPPLRERREDLPMLVEQILEDIRKETAKQLKISDEAMDPLLTYRWPGNVRELINTLQFASIRCAGEEILRQHLPPEIRSEHNTLAASERPVKRGKNFKLNATQVNQALQKSHGNRSQAAELLGVGRATLYRFLGRNDVSHK